MDADMLTEVARRAQSEADATTSLPRCAYLAGVEDALRWVTSGEISTQMADLVDAKADAAA